MINITPTTNYNTNFKAKTDCSKIYKEMERITLVREEKIIPKPSHKPNISFNKHVQNVKNKLKKLHTSSLKSDKIDNINTQNKEKFMFDPLLHGCVFPMAIAACAAGLAFIGYMYLQFKNLNNQPENTEIVIAQENNDSIKNQNTNNSVQFAEINKDNYEQYLNAAKADSLETLSNDSTISFDEYRKQMNDSAAIELE